MPGLPTTAERVRTAYATATSAMLAIDGAEPTTMPVPHLLGDGSVEVTVPVDGRLAAATSGAEAVLEVVDYSPLSLREPLRSLVWIRGRLQTVSPSPRLTITSVVVADATGAEAVDVDAFLSAQPDPFCALESWWLRHIDADHREVVDLLAARLPGRLRRGRIRPLGIDRFGLRLRVENDDGNHDVRLPFSAPDDLAGLSRAIRVLMGCPFLNGLRARRC